MKRVLILAYREWRSIFDSPIAYIFLIAYVALSLFVMRLDFYEQGQASLRILFANMDKLLLILVPPLAMRLWAEEKRSGTFQLLLTWPVHLWEVVLAKFLAASGLVALSLALLVPTAFLVSSLGPLDWGPVILGFAGAWLLGMAYLAVSCFVSSLTSSQIVAYLLSLGVCALLLVIGEPFLAKFWPTSWVSILENLGFGSRFRHFEYGLFRWADFVYYFSWIVLGLFLTSFCLSGYRRSGR